ncbi:MAG: SDR family NAD(P)-dependent oxidoreductase [Candidatus Omnitrophota bacterium]
MASSCLWRGKRVLVTGGTGFIGANLLRRLLAEGAHVSALIRHAESAWRLKSILHEIDILPGDISRPEDVENAVTASRPGVIFHLATARSIEAVENLPLFISTNVLGASNLILSAKRAGIKAVVYTGSQLEYGHSASAHVETDRLSPYTLHGVTKAAATMSFQGVARQIGFPVVILRLFHVYGPWESPQRFIPTLIAAALKGETVAMTEKGFRRDYIYIDDVIEALLIAARRPDLKGEVFNIASGRQVLNEEVAAIVERCIGKEIDSTCGAYAAHLTDTGFRVADIRKARSVLGWEPKVDLDSGIKATIDWLSPARNYPDRAGLISKYGLRA